MCGAVEPFDKADLSNRIPSRLQKVRAEAGRKRRCGAIQAFDMMDQLDPTARR
jgi:hypothetical protein